MCFNCHSQNTIAGFKFNLNWNIKLRSILNRGNRRSHLCGELWKFLMEILTSPWRNAVDVIKYARTTLKRNANKWCHIKILLGTRYRQTTYYPVSNTSGAVKCDITQQWPLSKWFEFTETITTRPLRLQTEAVINVT